MPRTAHAFAGHQALGERSMIMRAMCADGEDFITASYQQHLLIADIAQKFAVDEILDCDTLREVRSARHLLLFRHRAAPAFGRISPAAGSFGTTPGFGGSFDLIGVLGCGDPEKPYRLAQRNLMMLWPNSAYSTSPSTVHRQMFSDQLCLLLATQLIASSCKSHCLRQNAYQLRSSPSREMEYFVTSALLK